MTEPTKHDLKWILTVIGSTVGLLVITITSTIAVMNRFTTNDLEHVVINGKIDGEVYRSTTVDGQRDKQLSVINAKLDSVMCEQREMSTTQTEVVTNQRRILSEQSKMTDSIAELSRKIQ